MISVKAWTKELQTRTNFPSHCNLRRVNTETGWDIERAREVLMGGQLCAIPTETVYGLAANAFLPEAVVRIFEVKQRPAFDPLIVHIAEERMISEVASEFPDVARKLAAAFWPGALTLVLPKTSRVPYLVTSGLDTVGVRWPSHPLTLQLLRLLPFPLAAPSANPFGYISPTSAAHVTDQLGGKIPYILDGGSCSVGIESTIIDCTSSKPVVLRLGGLSIEAIERVAGHIEVISQSSSNPSAPGMLASHYAPRIPLFLGDIELLLPLFSDKKIATLTLQNSFENISGEQLSPSGNLSEAARALFSAMRRLDQSGADVILAERMPEEGLGRAINDRLQRAAAPRSH